MSIYKTNMPFHQLDLSLLRHFFVVANFGGFSRASRATGISQPALSLGLKKLEKILGVVLIRRSDRTFALTKEGLSLFTLCQSFEANLDETLDAFHSKNAKAPGRHLRIGTALSIGFGPTVPLCLKNMNSREFREIELIAQSTFKLLNDLSEGTLDAALVPDDVYDARLSLKKLWKDRVVFVSPKSQREKYGDKDWKDKLTAIPLITYPRETPMRALIDKFCSLHGLKFQTIYSANSVDAIKLLVSRQSGGAFVLRSLVSDELGKGTLVEAKLPVELPKSGVSLATRKGDHGDSVAKLIVAALHA